MRYDVFETSLGWMAGVASDKGLRRLTLPERHPLDAERFIEADISAAVRSPEAFAGLRQRVDRYFAGEPVDLADEDVDFSGASAFFLTCWQACRTIPRGETRSYAWLAARAGRPGASRGAGQAMARNRLPLVVPCHRVIGSDGRLHGFGGGIGLPLKQRLLELEHAAAPAHP